MRMRFATFLAATFCAMAANPLPFENELVKVIRAGNVPGQKSRPHVHRVNRVMIHLSKGEMKIAYPDGSARDIPFVAGQVRWDPKVGLHTSENTGGTAFKIIEIELKNDPGSGAKLAAAPEGASVELENDQVRVLRFKPAESVRTPTLNRPALAVRLDDGETTFLAKGDPDWQLPAGTVEWITVELK